MPNLQIKFASQYITELCCPRPGDAAGQGTWDTGDASDTVPGLVPGGTRWGVHTIEGGADFAPVCGAHTPWGFDRVNLVWSSFGPGEGAQSNTTPPALQFLFFAGLDLILTPLTPKAVWTPAAFGGADWLLSVSLPSVTTFAIAARAADVMGATYRGAVQVALRARFDRIGACCAVPDFSYGPDVVKM